MSNLQIFTYSDKQVRTLLKNGEPWFVAKDVCEILEISNPRDAVSRLDDDEKYAVGITDTIGREQQTTVISESGVYALVFTSRKPEAENFKRWLRKEVIPSIRKTGSYIKPMSQTEILHQMTGVLLEQEKQIKAISGTIENIKDAVISQPDNWRESINRNLNKISQTIGQNKFQEVRAESYKLLEQRAGVNLERRLLNKRARMFEDGCSNTAITKANKLDIIDEDKKLREIYSKIVSEYLIKYVA